MFVGNDGKIQSLNLTLPDAAYKVDTADVELYIQPTYISQQPTEQPSKCRLAITAPSRQCNRQLLLRP